MKVMFLDNDGVICLSNNWGSRNTKRRKAGLKLSVPYLEIPVDIRLDNFDKKAVKILNEIGDFTPPWKSWVNITHHRVS
jgi:hypothetical protein